MKRFKLHFAIAAAMVFASCQGDAMRGIETHETIMKVRSGADGGERFIAASTYDGDIMRVSYNGTVAWQAELDPGIMNHDMDCYDLDGDGVDEILVACANGTLYALSSRTGETLWSFHEHDAPMYAVAGFQKGGERFVACSSYDLNLNYLSAEGELVEQIPASEYSLEQLFTINDGNVQPKSGLHSVNFIRTYTNPEGEDILVVHGQCHSMNAKGGRGAIYLFEAGERAPYMSQKIDCEGPFGALSVSEEGEILMGNSSMRQNANILRIDINDLSETFTHIPDYGTDKIINFGYRVVQTEGVNMPDGYKYFTKFGDNIILNREDVRPESATILKCRFSFNDMALDRDNNVMILASEQSGGSYIYLLDLDNPEWMAQYEALQPNGTIKQTLDNSATARKQLEAFTAPEYEKSPRPVYLMSESREGVEHIIEHVKRDFVSPIFLNSAGSDSKEDFDRAAVISEQRYIDRRDARMKYTGKQADIVEQISSSYADGPGIAFWGGHGNDPYMYSLDTHKKIIDRAEGKKTVFIYPELEEHNEVFSYVLDNLIYPLAEYCRPRNGNVYVRTKTTFWQSIIYLPMWSRLVTGEFADVFVPAMEETSDKTMDLSIAARLGIWASGATDSWGSRGARDNTSFDRLRQYSHQNVPSHFFRMMVYHTSYGTQYIDNFPIDQNYMSLFWEMVGKGLIYVAERDEIVSFSPVHVSMLEPDHVWIDKANNIKWTTFFDQKFEDEHKYVFGRVNGTWPGAKVSEWDFSRYAAGVKDRHLHFLPPYNNGIVLITPPQEGAGADLDAPRGKMTDHLHPLYKDIMKEYYTDGRYYYSADGKEKYPAETYYKVIEQQIKESAKLIPVTVKGEVAWVTAQSAPKHLRLTLIDGGYINPSDKETQITFNTVRPVKITNLLSGEQIEIVGNKANVVVPCGTYTFLDIELAEAL